MKRKYVLKNKRRFAVIVMLFSLITIFTGLMVNAGAVSQTQNANNIIYVVQGDTLWEIALDYAQNSDPRLYIYEIKKLNRLEGDKIIAGQELLLP